MKYAIIEISGKQFWVEIGKYYDLNKIPAELGKKILLNRVLLINDEGNISIGKPYLKNVKVIGRVLDQLLDKKTTIYKMHSKKKTRSKQGRRQELTRVLIEDINLSINNN